MIRRLAFVLLFITPAAARADLPAAVPAVVKGCLAQGMTRGDLRSALESDGQVFLEPADRADALADLAPASLFALRMFAFDALPPDDAANAARLAEQIAGEVDRAAMTARSDDIFVDPGEGVTVLTSIDDATGSGSCFIALPPGDWTDDLATLFGQPADTDASHPWLSVARYGDAPTRPWLIAYAPSAFGGTETLPQLLLLRPASTD